MIQQLYDYAPENRLLGNVTGTIQIHDNLTAQTLLGADNSNSTPQSYAPRVSPIGAAFSGYARQAERSLQNLNFQQLLTFSKHMGENEVELVGGYEYTKNNNMEFAAAAQGFITDAYGVDNLNAAMTGPLGDRYSWHSEIELSWCLSGLNYGCGGGLLARESWCRSGPSVSASGDESVEGPGNRGAEGPLTPLLWTSAKKSLPGGLVRTVERNQATSLGDPAAACAADSTTQSFRAASNAKCTFIQSGFVFGQGQSNQYSQIILRGQPLGSFLAPRFIGVKNGQQYFACTVAGPSCANGQTTDPTDADREFIGSANPSFTLGVRNNAAWGALDMAWLWRGEFGGNTFNNTALVYQTKSDAAQGRNFIAAAIGMPDNIHEPAKFSSRWIESRTFVRLQNMTLGYKLPQSLTRGRTTRAYASGDNLLLFTGYSGYDP